MAKPELAWVVTIFPMRYAEYFVGVAVLEKPLGSWEARNEDSSRVHASKNPPVLLHFVYVYFPQNASSHFSLTPSSRILHQGLSSPRLRDNPFPAYWRCLLCDFGIHNKVVYLISLIILWHPSQPSKSVLSPQDYTVECITCSEFDGLKGSRSQKSV